MKITFLGIPEKKISRRSLLLSRIKGKSGYIEFAIGVQQHGTVVAYPIVAAEKKEKCGSAGG